MSPQNHQFSVYFFVNSLIGIVRSEQVVRSQFPSTEQIKEKRDGIYNQPSVSTDKYRIILESTDGFQT